MQSGKTNITPWGRLLLTNPLAQAGEIAIVFATAFAVILGTRPLVGGHPLAIHASIWLANVLMLLLIWLGLRLRGQDCGHFGLSFRRPTGRALRRTLGLSVAVFVFALAAFMTGAIAMAILFGRPERADLSGLDYLRGNLPLLILCLVAVYLASSFGEEVIYRAFLINRIAEMGLGGKWAWRIAVMISSLVFGLIHSDWALAGMVQTGLMGLALGISYLAAGRNLWVTILAHGYADTLLLVQLYAAQD